MKFAPFEGARNVRTIAHRGCRVAICSSENPEAVRGGDYAMAHLSEVAFWADTPQRTPEGLVRAICGSRCGRLSLNGTSFPESLSLIFTHRAAQYSKSVAMRCVSVIADGLRGSGAGVSRTVFLRTFGGLTIAVDVSDCPHHDGGQQDRAPHHD